MATHWKILASILLTGHFCAILSSVLAPPASPSAPLAARKVNEAAGPYLDALVLNSSFRFYAPNPGPARLTWYRVERADGTAVWYEHPLRHAWSPRTTYQRELALTSYLDMHLGPDSTNPKQLALSPVGRICAGSFVRQLARRVGRPENPVRAVELYTVHHRVLEPHQIAAGWGAYDLRLYRPCLLGRYLPDGSLETAKLGSHCPAAVESSRVGARMCIDLIAQRESISPHDLPPHWPRPVRELVQQFPELAAEALPENELKARIERLAESRTAVRVPTHPRTRR